MFSNITPQGFFAGLYLGFAINNAIEGKWALAWLWFVGIFLYLLIVDYCKMKLEK